MNSRPSAKPQSQSLPSEIWDASKFRKFSDILNGFRSEVSERANQGIKHSISTIIKIAKKNKKAAGWTLLSGLVVAGLIPLAPIAFAGNLSASAITSALSGWSIGLGTNTIASLAFELAKNSISQEGKIDLSEELLEGITQKLEQFILDQNISITREIIDLTKSLESIDIALHELSFQKNGDHEYLLGQLKSFLSEASGTDKDRSLLWLPENQRKDLYDTLGSALKAEAIHLPPFIDGSKERDSDSREIRDALNSIGEQHGQQNKILRKILESISPCRYPNSYAGFKNFCDGVHGGSQNIPSLKQVKDSSEQVTNVSGINIFSDHADSSCERESTINFGSNLQQIRNEVLEAKTALTKYSENNEIIKHFNQSNRALPLFEGKIVYSNNDYLYNVNSEPSILHPNINKAEPRTYKDLVAYTDDSKLMETLGTAQYGTVEESPDKSPVIKRFYQNSIIDQHHTKVGLTQENLVEEAISGPEHIVRTIPDNSLLKGYENSNVLPASNLPEATFDSPYHKEAEANLLSKKYLGKVQTQSQNKLYSYDSVGIFQPNEEPSLKRYEYSHALPVASELEVILDYCHHKEIEADLLPEKYLGRVQAQPISILHTPEAVEIDRPNGANLASQAYAYRPQKFEDDIHNYLGNINANQITDVKNQEASLLSFPTISLGNLPQHNKLTASSIQIVDIASKHNLIPAKGDQSSPLLNSGTQLESSLPARISTSKPDLLSWAREHPDQEIKPKKESGSSKWIQKILGL